MLTEIRGLFDKGLREVPAYVNSLNQLQNTYQCLLVTTFCSPLQSCSKGKVMEKGILVAFSIHSSKVIYISSSRLMSWYTHSPITVFLRAVGLSEEFH